MKNQKGIKKETTRLSESSRERLKKVIELRGTNYYQITKHFGYAPSTITNWLSGKVEKPDRTKINAVCQYLGISLHWLLTGENDTAADNQVKESANIEDLVKECIKPLSLEVSAQTEQYKALRTDFMHMRREMAELKTLLNRIIKAIDKE